MAKQDIKKSALEEEALALVEKERTDWEDATAWVTDRVAFQMRNLIRTLRKNYWGVFDLPKDPTTGRDKIWVPLTESLAESVVKNIDLDTKDINFRAKKPGAERLTNIVRMVVRQKLDEMNFGEDLDMLERDIAIDGTAVWKTFEGYNDQTGKREIKKVRVDLLNIYIDPTSPSIQEAWRFTERCLLSEQQVEAMKDWINTEDIQGTFGLARNDTFLNGSTTVTKNVKMVDVYEMWGKMPKYLMTGNVEDKNTEVDGHIIVSGLDSPGKGRVHMIEEYTGLKPYEEAWYTRVSGRWYGKGIAEKVMWLQLWMNIITNLNINRSYISQLGLFKIKRGAGITPQMIGRLASNGAISVNSMDDIENLIVERAQSEYANDIQIIQDWANRVTSAFEAVTGEALPSSTPATNAALQSRAAQSQFVLIKEGLGMFLQRWLKRHALPIMMKMIKPKDIVYYTGDLKDIQAFDDRIILHEAYKQIKELNDQSIYVEPAQVMAEIERAKASLLAGGMERFVTMDEKLDFSEYDVQVFITNEEFDKGVMTQNLMLALQAAPEYRTQILQQVFDLMGIGPLLAPEQPQMPQMGQEGPQNTPAPQGEQATPAVSPQQIVTQANTLNG